MKLPRSQTLVTHRRINDFLSLVVAVFAIYILALPLIPYVQLWWDKTTDKTDGYVYTTKLVPNPPKETKPIPKENRLVLPTIQLDEEVHEGAGFWTLNKGLWRRPHTSSPDQGGNTVIVGHRFTYDGPATFYHLDKIKPGDRFPMYWNGTEYNYEVSAVKVVSPLALEIEKNTAEPMLTIYTCTPLWSAKERLVIQAKLIEDNL